MSRDEVNRGQRLRIDCHDDVTYCFNTSTKSVATDCRAFPAGDSGKVWKMFEPCSQETQRFYKKKVKENVRDVTQSERRLTCH